MNILCCVDSGPSVGMGHFSRVMLLAHAARHDNQVAIMVGNDPRSMKDCVIESGIDWVDSADAYIADQMDCLGSISIDRSVDRIILDISHNASIQRIERLRKGILRLPDSVQLIMLDSLGEQALSSISPALAVDLVVLPYVGVSSSMSLPAGCSSLIGSKYALIDPRYCVAKKKSTRCQKKRILVSTGGSDPWGITEGILRAFDTVSHERIDVQVVLGPYFYEDYKRSLKELVSQVKYSIKLLDSPASLDQAMQWADVAVATSGLTKYELAATGTPSVLFSIDSYHRDANMGFMTGGSAIDLGVWGEFSLSELTQTVMSLLEDDDRYACLREAGLALVDGQGVARILEVMNRGMG